MSVNKLKSPQKGLELGRAGLGLRGVVPVFYENEHIGSLEFVFSFKSVLNKIKKITGADISVFVNKKLFSKICTMVSNKEEMKQSNLSNEQIEIINTIGNFRYLESTDKEKIMSLMTSTYLNKSNEFYTIFPILDGKEEGLSLEPLFDFSGAKIGTIIIVKNFDKLNEQYQAKFIKNIIIKLFQLLLIIIISIFVYNVWLMIPLHRISVICQNILNGKKDTFDEFKDKKNEIGKLAGVLTKLFGISPSQKESKSENSSDDKNIAKKDNIEE